MKRKLAVALAAVTCFAIPSCLTIDQAGLSDLGGDLLCGIVTSVLPFSGTIDYCSVVDIDLPIDEFIQ